jgi:superfamily II DNA/RNA helicase
MALTATPTLEVRQNLPESLAIQEYTVVEGLLDRKELFIEVRPVNGIAHFDPEVLKEIKQQKGLTMVFCQQKNLVQDLFTEAVAVLGNKVAVYHASLTTSQKARVMERLMKQEISCVITTSALGMGLNIPNVRWVILHGVPPSVLDLAQQMGRACRDQQQGKVTLLVSSRTAAAKKQALSAPAPAPAPAPMPSSRKLVSKGKGKGKMKPGADTTTPAEPASALTLPSHPLATRELDVRREKWTLGSVPSTASSQQLDAFAFGDGCKRQIFLRCIFFFSF